MLVIGRPLSAAAERAADRERGRGSCQGFFRSAEVKPANRAPPLATGLSSGSKRHSTIVPTIKHDSQANSRGRKVRPRLMTWIDILFVAVVVMWLLLALRAFLKEP
jgi:hypothetical protein